MFLNSLNNYCREVHDKIFNLPNGWRKKHCLDILYNFWFGSNCEAYNKKGNGKFGWINK